MAITPGITQAADLLNNLVNQGKDPNQQIRNLSIPETVVNPANTELWTGMDPVIGDLAFADVGGIIPSPVEKALVGYAIVGYSTVSSGIALVGYAIVGDDYIVSGPATTGYAVVGSGKVG